MDMTGIAASKEKIQPNTVKMLIADNDGAASSMIFVYFSNRGYDLRRAAGVTDIISVVLNKEARVIIIDTEFCGPETPGLVRIIKRLDRDVEIILTSGNGPAGHIARAREAGIFFYAPKPFDFNELEMAVKQASKYNGGE